MALTPLTRRRLANFKANRRGYWSLWIFLTLFGISLCSEFIANDKPILMEHDGRLMVPVFFTYTEAELGGTFLTEANYSDPHVQGLIEGSGGWMIWPVIRFSHSTIDWYIDEPAPAPPSARHWLGTDDGARDVVARLLYGFRLSVSFGLALTLIASVIGVTAGAIQGYYGGWVDLLGQRLIEIWSGLPLLFLLIILSSMVEPGVGWLLALLVLFSWMTLVSVVRAEFLRTRNFEYVRAARALGVSDRKIMFKHVLPNSMVATLTYLPFILNGSITTLTALDFLGFGLPPGSPSLGELLAQGKSNIQSPWLGLTGFATLAIMLTLLIFVGEAVRDAFDPRRSIGDDPPIGAADQEAEEAELAEAGAARGAPA
ncbi:MAG: ABC transporter permease [Gammaproteobacteria bacterium]|nr:ABC transporter permease [Gammaproteobacteria bacterium]